MREPAIYRIHRATHQNTGDTWCIYLLYTLVHLTEDALEQTATACARGSLKTNARFTTGYQEARIERVHKVQGISSENSWMRTTPDPAWLFSLDAWNVPLFEQKRT